MLEEHIIPQLKIIGYGMGTVSEQGGECSHKLMNSYRERFGEIHTPIFLIDIIVNWYKIRRKELEDSIYS